jgi:hypothetical protein
MKYRMMYCNIQIAEFWIEWYMSKSKHKANGCDKNLVTLNPRRVMNDHYDNMF